MNDFIIFLCFNLKMKATIPIRKNSLKILVGIIIVFFYSGCYNPSSPVKEKQIVEAPEQMDDQVSANLESMLSFAKDNNGLITDSVYLSHAGIVNSFYEENNYRRVWGEKESWNPVADSMFSFIKNSKYFGLYPDDYHYRKLDSLRIKISNDSMVRKDAIAWTKADLMLTDAFFKTLKDLKEGRIVADSNSFVSKNGADSFFIRNLRQALVSKDLTRVFKNVEPNNSGYFSLKNALAPFVDEMDTMKYLYINFPYKDTISFYKNLHKRLLQSGIGDSTITEPDSMQISKEVKRYQIKHKLKADGKPGRGTVLTLNSNDHERFKRIALTLDRYKQLPPLPESYIWVNLPGFYLKVWDHDTVVLQSKVIIGKPSTRTPVLTSAISNMVTYPNWTIPASIIKKDILPALKLDPGYLERKGFSLVDSKGEAINPYTVDWTKYKKGIPWKIVQGSGDDNALGIFKFNFNNPYSVYLHDTNQRYLFNNEDLALSHGCVRVQDWQGLAYFIATNDSLATKEGHPLSYNIDSIKSWVNNKARKTIMVKKKVPLFIEYFTCEAKNDRIVVYDDVYGSDRNLLQKYFADK
jgi:murein L,D-transpeptidase YcbB/YkuD